MPTKPKSKHPKKKPGPPLLAGPLPPEPPRRLVHPVPAACVSEELLDRIWKAAGSPAVPHSELPQEVSKLRALKTTNRKLLCLIERLAAEVPTCPENEDLLLDAGRTLAQS